jgi:cytochrome c2
MTANELVARSLVGVALATAAITGIGLWFGQTRTPLPAYHPTATIDVAPGEPSPARGEALLTSLGCTQCHTTDGSTRIGPSFAKRWGTSVALADGSHVTFDEAYVRESVLSPQAKARPGYPPVMPTFDGLIKDRQLADIVAYLKTL